MALLGRIATQANLVTVNGAKRVDSRSTGRRPADYVATKEQTQPAERASDEHSAMRECNARAMKLRYELDIRQSPWSPLCPAPTISRPEFDKAGSCRGRAGRARENLRASCDLVVDYGSGGRAHIGCADVLVYRHQPNAGEGDDAQH